MMRPTSKDIKTRKKKQSGANDATRFLGNIGFQPKLYKGATHLITSDAMAPIPDHPSCSRFCRQCSSYLPLSEFHGGVRRFECKKHALERASRYRKKARPEGAEKRAVARVWHALWADSKMVFGRQKAGLTQADVRRLFAEKGVEPDLSWRVVPKDPDDEWGFPNAAVVPKAVRRELVAVFVKNSENSVQQYHDVLTACRVE